MDTLYLLPVNALGLVDVNLFNKLTNYLRCELCHLSVPADNPDEPVYVYGAFFLRGDKLLKFSNTAFKPSLFFFVACGHLGKALIRNLTFDVILIKTLNNLIQLVDSDLCLF